MKTRSKNPNTMTPFDAANIKRIVEYMALTCDDYSQASTQEQQFGYMEGVSNLAHILLSAIEGNRASLKAIRLSLTAIVDSAIEAVSQKEAEVQE